MPLPRLFRTSSFRLTLLYAGLFSLSVLLLFAVIYWSTAGYMTQQIDESIATELTQLQDLAGGRGLAALKAAVAERTMRAPRGMFYLLEDNRGEALAGNLPPIPPDAGVVSRDTPQRSASNHRALDHRAQELRGRGVRVADGGYLFVGQDNFWLKEMEELITRAFLAGLTATIVLAVAGGAVMSVGLLQRVESISRTSREIVDGNLSRRIATRGTDDEFDHLAGSLNTMFDRIQALMDGLRQVSNDIAHDLRTPLTRLRQRLELARHRAVTVEALQAALDSSVRDVDAILDTFGALLRIAQIEAGTRKAGFTELDLSELLQSMVEVYQPVAEERNQTLNGWIDAGLTVRGDRELLTQMLANLIENAIRHSPAGARIDIGGRRNGNVVSATIADTGPGIPAELRHRVFERFYRLETSRSTPGSGLGLSLVAAVAALHEIHITLADRNPGVSVDLRLPLTAG